MKQIILKLIYQTTKNSKSHHKVHTMILEKNSIQIKIYTKIIVTITDTTGIKKKKKLKKKK